MEKDHCLSAVKKAEMEDMAKRAYSSAVTLCEHGRELSGEHFLALFVPEVSEAIEADCRGRRADEWFFGLALQKGYDFSAMYHTHIKGTVEEGLADIVIRLLDMAWGLYGEKMEWKVVEEGCQNKWEGRKECSFVENMWYFVRNVLGSSEESINNSIDYIVWLAENRHFNLIQHVQWKMEYRAILIRFIRRTQKEINKDK